MTITEDAKNYPKSNFFLSEFEMGQVLRKGYDLMETKVFIEI